MITGISSMATRDILAELAQAYRSAHGVDLVVESVGGVEAARRVRAGENVDFIVLAREAIESLAADGFVVPGSRVDIADSGIAVAVRDGVTPPEIGTEAALKRAVLDAESVAYSTGPSGTYLLGLFERWGIAKALVPRAVQAPAGVPVGSFVASGRAALGFQQLSELVHMEGIVVAGLLPPGVQRMTTFSGAVCSASRDAPAARHVLESFASPDVQGVLRRHGMESING
jgi:molybdate transport system substrate-binding protein